jgi:hypothetical protein
MVTGCVPFEIRAGFLNNISTAFGFKELQTPLTHYAQKPGRDADHSPPSSAQVVNE